MEFVIEKSRQLFDFGCPEMTEFSNGIIVLGSLVLRISTLASKKKFN